MLGGGAGGCVERLEGKRFLEKFKVCCNYKFLRFEGCGGSRRREEGCGEGVYLGVYVFWFC